MLNIEEHRAGIRASLTAWATAISSELPNVEWHIQDLPSHIYALSQLLVFVDKRAVMDELVVSRSQSVQIRPHAGASMQPASTAPSSPKT